MIFEKIKRFFPPLMVLGAFFISCNNNGVEPCISPDKEMEEKIEKHIAEMTLEEKVGQMMQITLTSILKPNLNEIDEDLLDNAVSKYKVGSFLNVLWSGAVSREKMTEIVRQIQDKSIEELGIPTVYGLDMIHGASYTEGAIFFPQEINLAASFDEKFAKNMGVVTAYETRATMVPWVFTPVMDLAATPCWSRMWESWGEDPLVASRMSVAEVEGLQGNNPNKISLEKVGACMKHYIAYGAPRSGKDRTPAYIPNYELKELYFPPFKACAENGVLTAMVNSATLNGIPVHANKELLTNWLKKGLNWDGMLVTDWNDLNNLYTRDHIVNTKEEALALGINAGIDMVMEPEAPSACEDLKAAVNHGLITMDRIDDAVRRVLRFKYRLGLFDNPTWTIDEYNKFGCEEFKDMAYQAALESEVLLKNQNNILPLQKGTKILVVGPNANSVRALNGGWSYTWQGSDDERFVGKYNSIYEALSEKFGKKNVKCVPGISYKKGDGWKEEYKNNYPTALNLAHNWADVIVACVGENSYCETPGNLENLSLSSLQCDLVKDISKSKKPIVLILNEGRPRVISKIEPLASAVIDVLLPGNYGGDALAALLSGEENFSAKLPYTYPKHVNSLHVYNYKVNENVGVLNGMYNYDARMDVQWEFGEGLSYTEFEYSDFRCDINALTGKKIAVNEFALKENDILLENNIKNFSPGDVLEISVKVKNVGKRPGKLPVLLFSSDIKASMVPEVRRLRDFTKTKILNPGETEILNFKIDSRDLAFVSHDMRKHLEEGLFRFSCGSQELFLNCVSTLIF